MKNWLGGIALFLFGMILSAILFLVISPPRGHAIELLPAPTPAPIVVHVDGAVLQPGVYHLSRDSRILEAVSAAGGLSPDADNIHINLAARMKDGDKIIIPSLNTPAAITPVAETTQPSNHKINPTTTPSYPINLNTASQEELDQLPGIGPTRAQQIIEYRQAHNGFKSIDDIMNVTGIGKTTFDKLKDLITVE